MKRLLPILGLLSLALLIGGCQTFPQNGQGTYTFTNGDKYVGEFKDSKRNGQGTYSYANGDMYVGVFKDGKYDVQGTYTFANGDKYVGEYKDDKRTGQGTFTFANGDKHIGEFKDGKRNGQGTFTFANGNKSYVKEEMIMVIKIIENSRLTNIKIGITEDSISQWSDYEDGFRGYDYVHWYFSIITDEESDFHYLYGHGGRGKYYGYEELANAIGKICEDSKIESDVYGSPIKLDFFVALVLALLDKPEGYPCMKNVLNEIGGKIIVDEDTDRIPEEYVNSLFAIREDHSTHEISDYDGEIKIGDSTFDPTLTPNPREVPIKRALFTGFKRRL
jgi:hypothetical protein